MKNFVASRRLGIMALIPLLVAAVAFRPAAPMQVAGAFTLTYVKSTPNGTNSRGASIFISTATGKNKNTGTGTYLSGARVVNVDTSAMVEGNGSHSGYATLSETGNSIVKRFTGKITTKMVGNRPESTFSGTWTVVRGTGRYNGATGNGTYTGRFDTPKKYTVTWKGTISM